MYTDISVGDTRYITQLWSTHTYKFCQFFHAVDLAVDWLNDKLYWVDGGLRRIEEYDLNSGLRRVVTSTGSSEESRPAALALYPYPNYG